MSTLRAKSIRFPVDPRDVSPEKAARRLGLTLAEFEPLKDELFARGFPKPDPTTGNYDLVAIKRWQDQRSGIAPTGATLTSEPRARDASEVFSERARLLNGV
jgi:hypothetical protein